MRKTKTLKESFNTDVIPKIKKLLENRHRILAPFPADPLEIYALFWDDTEREAIQILKRREGLLVTRNFFGLDCSDPKTHISCKIRVTLPTSMPIPWETISTYNLPAPMDTQIREWVPVWVAYRKETTALVLKVEELAAKCSTYGQALRIWPELLGLFPAEAKERLDKARSVSKYPDAVRLFGGSATLMEGFRPEDYAPFTATLAEALMLPFEDNLRHLASVEM